MNGLLARDERERAVDRDADRITAAVLSFGILVLVLLRSLRGEAAWDLLALVIGAGLVGTAHRARRQATDRRWWAFGLAAAVLAVVVAAAISRVVR